MLVLNVTNVLGRATSGVVCPLVYPGRLSRLNICNTYIGVTVVVTVVARTFHCTCRPVIFTGIGSGSTGGCCTATVGWFVVFALLTFLTIATCVSLLRRVVNERCHSKLGIIPVIVLTRVLVKMCFGLSF